MSLIKAFRTNGGGLYAYDAITNRIISIDEKVLCGDRDLELSIPEAELEAMLCDMAPDDRTSFDGVAWKRGIPGGADDSPPHSVCRIVIQLTRDCNLNCAYCVYSGAFAGMEPHSSADMDEDTLRASIDFAASHSPKSGMIDLSFYGGEALLRFDLIRRGVDYAGRKLTDRQIRYSISTNGLLLKGAVMDWLAEHPEVHVVVTLNGPFHDRYRRTPDGQGSLHVIMENLVAARDRYPEVWENQILFLANLASHGQLPELFAFYRKNIGRPPESVSAINTDHACESLRTAVAVEAAAFENKKVEAQYIRGDDDWLNQYYDEHIETIHLRGIKHDRTPVLRSCLPLQDKVFIHVDGDIGICESVSDRLRLGNVRAGIDYTLLAELKGNALALYNAQCLRCWNRRFCPVCFKDILDPNGKVLSLIPDEKCVAFRRDTLSLLKRYCDKVHYGTYPSPRSPRPGSATAGCRRKESNT